MVIKIDNLNIHYIMINEKEQAPPLVILHGWGSSIGNWKKVLDQLQSLKIPIIILDLPGFGKSDEPKEIWNIDQYAIFLKTFLHTIKTCYMLHVTRYMILGHSFGGQIAVKFLSTHPGMIDKLILISAAVIRPELNLQKKIIKAFSNTLHLEKLPDPLKKFGYRVLGGQGYEGQTKRMKEIFRKVAGKDLSKEAGKIENKTLIIWGEEDTLTPLTHGKKLNELIPRSSLKIIPNAKHALNATHVNELTRLIQNFIIENPN